jgi:vanillate/3-O-methylgallate O-demethylase
MSRDSLEDLLQSVENPVELFRNNDLIESPYIFPDEYTNWIEEQRAVREACAIVDQSYHMDKLRIEGPDAVEFLAGVGVNDFDKFRERDPPQAINMIACNPDGYAIGDVILFYRDEDVFDSVGGSWVNNWIQYNAELTDRRVTAHTVYDPFEDGPPEEFRFQIQGPDAIAVMEEVTDEPLPDVSFFQMDTIRMNGQVFDALGHGMAATPGLEIFGPYRYHDEVLESILKAGEAYGIRRMGSKAYKTGKIGSGWFVMSVPAIYESEEMTEYREWVGADSIEAQLSIGGSYASDDITDYYMTLMERGQRKLVDFDHEFVGRKALQEMMDDQQRERVTFVWDEEDIVEVYHSLFGDGETNKFIHMPDVATRSSWTHYDTVLKDGEEVGLSKYPGYLYYEREMLSLGTIDLEYSEPGTEVTFVWGEETEKSRVERHEKTEIGATVAPAPYVRGGRKSM